MSPLSSPLDELRQEFQREGFGSGHYHEAELVMRHMARRYPAALYSDNSVWDADALGGLLHDWIVERLLVMSRISYFLMTNDTLAGFRSGLHSDFRQFMASRRKRSALANLYGRVHAALGADARFRLLAPSKDKGEQVWGRSGWEPERARIGVGRDALRRAAFAVANITEVTYRAEAAKLSPVLEGPDLPQFLAGVLEEAGLPLTLEELLDALAIRFNLHQPTEVPFDGPPDEVASERGLLPPAERLSRDRGDYADALVLDEVARGAIAELSGRQRRILLERTRPGSTYATIAAVVDCGKSTVATDLDAAIRLVGEHALAGRLDYDALNDRILDHLAGAA